MGNCRSMYYISNKSQIDMKRVDKLLRKLIGTTTELQAENSLSKDTLQLTLSSGYDILLSLLVPEPEALESKWDIKRGVKGEYPVTTRDFFQVTTKQILAFT